MPKPKETPPVVTDAALGVLSATTWRTRKVWRSDLGRDLPMHTNGHNILRIAGLLLWGVGCWWNPRMSARPLGIGSFWTISSVPRGSGWKSEDSWSFSPPLRGQESAPTVYASGCRRDKTKENIDPEVSASHSVSLFGTRILLAFDLARGEYIYSIICWRQRKLIEIEALEVVGNVAYGTQREDICMSICFPSQSGHTIMDQNLLDRHGRFGNDWPSYSILWWVKTICIIWSCRDYVHCTFRAESNPAITTEAWTYSVAWIWTSLPNRMYFQPGRFWGVPYQSPSCYQRRLPL